jgi:hypothetical protein
MKVCNGWIVAEFTLHCIFPVSFDSLFRKATLQLYAARVEARA